MQEWTRWSSTGDNFGRWAASLSSTSSLGSIMVLDKVTLLAFLSCRLTDAARALETGSASNMIWDDLVIVVVNNYATMTLLPLLSPMDEDPLKLLPVTDTWDWAHALVTNARYSLSVPCRPGTPTYNLKEKTTARCATTGCHVSHSSGPCLLAEGSSGAVMCPSAFDLTSP
jgi:hypothetical protein